MATCRSSFLTLPFDVICVSIHCSPKWMWCTEAVSLSVSLSGGCRLFCYATSCSISICTLMICLALTAGLYQLIAVNCVPPLHNQLMWLRPVRCALRASVFPHVRSFHFNRRPHWMWSIIFTIKDPKRMIIRFQRVCNEEHQLMRCIYNYKFRVLKKAGERTQ